MTKEFLKLQKGLIVIKADEKTIKKWHRLDNSANIYPAISNKNFASVYRLSAILTDDIKPELLQIAVEKTLKHFTVFNVRLKNGLFWHYFEANNLKPVVIEENDFPSRYINRRENNLFLFQVSYYQNKVNLEIFHALTDATGGYRFLKAICYKYIKLAYPKDFTGDKEDKVYGISYATDNEDSYKKNYVPVKKDDYSSSRAYQFKGTFLPVNAVRHIHAEIPVADLKKVCKQMNCSITQYLVTCLYWGIYTDSLNNSPEKQSVNIFIPVNLRPFFGSTTSLNFFSGVGLEYLFTRNDVTFEKVLESIKVQFKEKLTKEAMLAKISYTVGSGYSFPVRIVPLLIKQFILKIIYFFSSKTNTMTLSNIGQITVDENFEKYFEKFYFLMGPSNKEPIKSSAISFDDTLMFTIGSVYRDTDLQKTVYRKMVDDGLNITIHSNGVYNEIL